MGMILAKKNWPYTLREGGREGGRGGREEGREGGREGGREEGGGREGGRGEMSIGVLFMDAGVTPV